MSVGLVNLVCLMRLEEGIWSLESEMEKLKDLWGGDGSLGSRPETDKREIRRCRQERRKRRIIGGEERGEELERDSNQKAGPLDL